MAALAGGLARRHLARRASNRTPPITGLFRDGTLARTTRLSRTFAIHAKQGAPARPGRPNAGRLSTAAPNPRNGNRPPVPQDRSDPAGAGNGAGGVSAVGRRRRRIAGTSPDGSFSGDISPCACDAKSHMLSSYRRLEGWLVHADRRRNSGLVLVACPRPGVRARVLLARVRSPGKKPRQFPCHPEAAGEGKAGRANSSEPLMTPRYEKPRIGVSLTRFDDHPVRQSGATSGLFGLVLPPALHAPPRCGRPDAR